ncbi:hypothetical protein HPB50_012635 [Hyalomma asiaticum]|uniref:Uncharacterized protein n=1 Tax=Hyalomma asiaticum TaxID=266040 RepID=A0ACB7TJ73_HYAAI|nr:hypothetical protein HPB50_012635 [Hyalomma asiaticum]
MRSMYSGKNPPCAAGTLRGKGLVSDREVLHAQASRRRRDQRFDRLGARRRIAVANEAPRETPDDAMQLIRQLRDWKLQRKLVMVGAPKRRAPFRPPSHYPNPFPAPGDYSCFRQQHLHYYDRIRHRFMRNTSSVGGGQHASCKASHAASQNSEWPPRDASSQVSFAPADFKFQYQFPGTKRIATREAYNGRLSGVRQTSDFRRIGCLLYERWIGCTSGRVSCGGIGCTKRGAAGVKRPAASA